MKASEIKVGGVYTAKISGKIVRVKVEAIRSRTTFAGRDYGGKSKFRDKTVYDVLNLTTGRRTTFKSAARFSSAVDTGEETLRDTAFGDLGSNPQVRRPPETDISISDKLFFDW